MRKSADWRLREEATVVQKDVAAQETVARLTSSASTTVAAPADVISQSPSATPAGLAFIAGYGIR
jgi:hypothetical protein